MKKYLIVNADDFGYSNGRNKGILQCHKLSAISSVSLMVNAVEFQSAATLCQQHNLNVGKLINQII